MMFVKIFPNVDKINNEFNRKLGKKIEATARASFKPI